MGDEAVKVVVRCRPMNSKETAEGRKPVVDVNSSANMVTIINPDANAISADPKSFTFDAVYDSESTQRAVYDETAYPLVDSVLSGYNGTIFAYGQTGCGKTHTMQGRNEPAELRGIIPNSFDHIFDHIKLARDKEFLVRCSYLEIYNEEIRDLLAKDPNQKMELHETPDTGVFVKDLTQVVVDSGAAIDKVMTDGNKHRTTGATLMNDQSSRSHSIFTIIIEMSSMGEDGKDHITRGKLNLVDLAGSERPAKTGATGTRMKEGIKINLSLTALGNVISALVEGAGKARHIPYRDSKLTRLLQDSLGGNTKTVMVAAVGPADYNYDETLSTLRYANRAKNIKNKPVINEDPKDALLRQYKEEIDRLKQLLVQHLSAAGLAPEALNAILSQANAMGMAMGAAGGGGGGGGLGAMGAMMGAAAAAASGGGSSKALTNKPSASNLGKPSSGSASSRSVAAGAALSAGSSGSGSDTPKAAPNAQLSPLPSPTDADAAGSSSRAATEAAATIIDGSPAAADQFDATNTAAGTDSGAGTSTTDNSSAVAAGDGLSPPPDNASGASGVTPSALPSGQATPSRPASGQAAPSTSTLTARPSITATPTAAGTSGAALADYARASPRGAAAATAAATLSPTQSFRAGGSSNSINSGGSGNSAGNNSGAASANGSFAGLGAEAQEAIEAARRDAERERKEREELARKLLALQQMVVGKGGASANGGPGGNGGGGASRNGGDLSGLLRSGSNGGADTDEIAQARAREDQRKADLLKAQQKRKAALSPQKSGDMGLDGGDGDGMDGDDEDPGVGNAGSNAGGDASAAAGSGGAGSGGGGGGAGGDRAKLTRPEKERLVKKVKAKYAGRIDALKREILDLQDEHAQQRESLMNTVREQSKEAKLLEALVALFLSPLEVSKVWERAVWNEETEEWSLPRVKPRPGFEIRSKVANRARQPLPRQKAGAVMPGAGNNKGGRSGVNAANSEGSDTETTTVNNGGGYNTNGSVIGSDPGGLGSDASSYGGADAGMDGVSYGRYGNSDGYAEDNDDADEEGGAVIDGEGEVQARGGGGAMPRVKGAESQQQAGGRAASGGHRSKSNDDGSLPSLPGGGAPSGGNAGGRRPQHPAAGMDDSGGGGGLPSLGDRGRSQTKAAAAGSSGSATGGREATSMPAIGGRGNAQPYQQQQQQPPQANNGFFMLPGLGPGFHNIQIPGLQGLNGLGNLQGQLASLGSLGLAGLNLPALGALQRPMPAAMQQQPQQQMHDGGGGGLPMLRGPAAGAANGMYPQLQQTSGLPVALPGLASAPMPSQLQHHQQMNGNYQQQQLPMMLMPAMQQQQPPQQSYASIGGGGGLPSLSGGGPPSRGSSLPPAAAAGSSKSQSGGGLPSLGGGAKGGPGPSGGKKSSGLGALPAI